MSDELDAGTCAVKRFCYVNRKAPYGSIYAHEMLETILISAAFEQDVSVIFVDDGVFQLLAGQDTSDLGIKNFSPTFRALEGYDVEKLYVEKESLDARGISSNDLVVDVQVMSSAEISEIMDAQDVVISA